VGENDSEPFDEFAWEELFAHYVDFNTAEQIGEKSIFLEKKGQVSIALNLHLLFLYLLTKVKILDIIQSKASKTPRMQTNAMITQHPFFPFFILHIDGL